MKCKEGRTIRYEDKQQMVSCKYEQFQRRMLHKRNGKSDIHINLLQLVGSSFSWFSLSSKSFKLGKSHNEFGRRSNSLIEQSNVSRFDRAPKSYGETDATKQKSNFTVSLDSWRMHDWLQYKLFCWKRWPRMVEQMTVNHPWSWFSVPSSVTAPSVSTQQRYTQTQLAMNFKDDIQQKEDNMMEEKIHGVLTVNLEMFVWNLLQYFWEMS